MDLNHLERAFPGLCTPIDLTWSDSDCKKVSLVSQKRA